MSTFGDSLGDLLRYLGYLLVISCSSMLQMTEEVELSQRATVVFSQVFFFLNTLEQKFQIRKNVTMLLGEMISKITMMLYTMKMGGNNDNQQQQQQQQQQQYNNMRYGRPPQPSPSSTTTTSRNKASSRGSSSTTNYDTNYPGGGGGGGMNDEYDYPPADGSDDIYGSPYAGDEYNYPPPSPPPAPTTNNPSTNKRRNQRY
jgi:hypothetical protein